MARRPKLMTKAAKKRRARYRKCRKDICRRRRGRKGRRIRRYRRGGSAAPRKRTRRSGGQLSFNFKMPKAPKRKKISAALRRQHARHHAQAKRGFANMGRYGGAPSNFGPQRQLLLRGHVPPGRDTARKMWSGFKLP